MAVGLLAGVRIEQQKRTPASVIRAGRTPLAIDAAVADAIEVRPA